MRDFPKPVLRKSGLLLIFSLFGLLSAVLAQGTDPAGSFLRGYTEFQNAERLEASGDYAQALTKFRFAASIMEQISRENPEWQPLVVQYRLRKIVEAINRVESQDTSGFAPPPVADGGYIEGDLPRFDPESRPSFPASAPTNVRPAPVQPAAPPASTGGGTDLQRLQQENRQLREQLNQRTAELKSALHEVDKTRVTVVELRHELAQSRTRLDDALKDKTSVEEIRKNFARQLAEIADEFEKTRAERDVLEEENQQLVEKLEQAAAYITASDAIREQLEAERRTFFEEREAARADRDKVQGELSTALTELQESRAKLSEIEILASENEALRKQTEEATAALAAMEEKARLSEEALESLRTDLAERSTEADDGELEKAREELANLRKEMEEQAAAVLELETLRASVAELEAKIAASPATDDASEPARVAELEKELDAARAQKIELEAKVAALSAESPDQVDQAELSAKLAAAEARIEELSGAQEEVRLLTQKLQDAEQKIAEAPSAASADQENMIATLQSEVNTVNDRLFSLRSELSARDNRIQTLEQQLDQTSAELTELRLTAASDTATKEAVVENELLRNILLRELREQARRQQARRLIEEEISKLQIQSESLVENLSVLGQGIELTEEEQSLFRMPVALIESGGADNMEVSIAITKPAAEEAVSANGTAAEEKPAAPPAGLEALTPAASEIAAQAQKDFDEGRLDEAEQKFFQLAEEFPENYYLLSQLAATQFQAGKTRAAEIALNRALSIKPDDAFALSILGVVYFRQGKLIEAEDALKRSSELEPGKARTFNYLGIVASQKGKLKEAEEYMQKALEIDPRYAEAHFNLAVIYATQEPPAIEMARKHYFSATSLGAEPDLAMERLLQ